MPIYDFRCSKCEYVFEVTKKYDDPAPICPKCETKETIQVINEVKAFIFKGSGWTSRNLSELSKRRVRNRLKVS